MLKKTPWLFLLLFFACFETFGTSIHQEQDPAPNCVLSSEDYQIFAAALADLGGPMEPKSLWQGKQILVSNITAQIVDRGWNENSRQTQSKIVPFADTRADFALRAKAACSIKRSFRASVPHQLISIKNGKKTSRGERWDNFGKKYPNAYGYLSFSLPGYNANHSEALLYVEHACGGFVDQAICICFASKRAIGEW